MPNSAEPSLSSMGRTFEPTSRQTEVLDLVRRQGFASIDDLAQGFEVTPQTIRRDVNELCELGMLRRHHGGVAWPSSVENVDYRERQVLGLAEKQRIAKLVARHIPDQASLLINIGTTTEEVARSLNAHTGLRVITNNLNVATILAGKSDTEVIVAGGVVRPGDRGITGEATIDFVNQFRVDIAVIGISGIDLDGTLLDFDYREVRVAQAIVACAQKVYLVADHTKFGRSALVRMGHLTDLSALFTDRSPPPEISRILQDAGVELHVADA